MRRRRGAVSVGRTAARCAAPGRVPVTLPELHAAIVDRYRQTGRPLPPDAEVLATHGATAALTAARCIREHRRSRRDVRADFTSFRPGGEVASCAGAVDSDMG